MKINEDLKKKTLLQQMGCAREKVPIWPNVLSRHTKRIGAHGRARPSFGMTDTDF